ncbi:MAG: hypothetical protein HY801_04270 [Candidatus Lindowbacteria bacterium]|nr:hypothetical protein [Candidatus Lindowbacteria bacterium]
MFDKIFGIFRKRKRADISQEIPGEGEDMLETGGAELGEEFDADTISLETGMSDGGFGSSSGGAAGGGLGEAVGVTEPPLDEDLGLDVGEEAPAAAPFREGAVSPPEVEPFTPPPAPKRKGRLKGVVAAVVVALIGLAAGFFGAKPGIELAKDLITPGPTPAQQLAQLQGENTKMEQQLTAYRGVGTLEEILAVKNELQKRTDMAAEVDAIERKVANRPAEEERLDRVSVQLDLTRRELLIQKGSLANVQKAVKQIEARNNYLMTSARKFLDKTAEAKAKSEVLKARLEPDRIKEAETAAFLSRETERKVGDSANEAFSSL